MKLPSLGELASRYAPNLYGSYLRHERRRQCDRVARLLACPGRSVLLPEGDFERLRNRSFPRPAAYQYDLFNSSARAAGRVQRLAALFPMLAQPRRVLEISAGDGLVGTMLRVGGHDVTLADVRDWRAAPARDLQFVEWDVGEAPVLEPGSFDLVIAYNATEHWPDPAMAVRRALELSRLGGYVLFDFGPLYNSPWGLHAWSLEFPYSQFLFPMSLIESHVRRTGVYDLGQDTEILQPTNGWSLAAYRSLWANCGGQVISNVEDRDFRYLDFVEEFMPCFRGRNLTFDEVTVNSIEIVLRKA